MSWTNPESKGPEFERIGALMLKARTAAGNGLKRDVARKELAAATSIPINRIRWHEAGDTLLRANEIVAIAKVLKVKTGDLL